MGCHLDVAVDANKFLPEHHLPKNVDCSRGLVTIMLHGSSLSAQLLPLRMSQADLIK